MKIYVAASSREPSRARAFADALERNGHTITHKWFNATIPEEGDSALTLTERMDVRRSCEAGVRAAELLVMLLSDNAQHGSNTERGIAIGAGVPVILVGSTTLYRRSAMYVGDILCHDDDDAIAWIGRAR